MSGVSLPVTRPSGRALLIGSAATRPALIEGLGRLGYAASEADDPYAGMLALCRQPLNYQAVILSLASLYREELPIIRTIKRRFGHCEVWLAHTDGRPGALAEAMRLGADGLLDDDGLHRIAVGGMSDEAPAQPGREDSPLIASTSLRIATAAENSQALELDDLEGGSDEPILSADELKALLHEQPTIPRSGEDAGGENFA
jgi:hypothetical protein